MDASLPIADRGASEFSSAAKPGSAVPAAHTNRHSALVRVTHWITTVAFLALLVGGGEIVLSHPRFYWGATGNVNMRPWLNLHLPSSRDTVPTGYGYLFPAASDLSIKELGGSLAMHERQLLDRPSSGMHSIKPTCRDNPASVDGTVKLRTPLSGQHTALRQLFRNSDLDCQHDQHNDPQGGLRSHSIRGDR
jgi:hypothetical protein